jgi:hypothetical protein
MRAYLLPILLLFLFACKEENDGQEDINPPIRSKAFCKLDQEYYLSPSDTSTKVVFATYNYDANGLIMIDQTFTQTRDPNPDTATHIIWDNGNPICAIKTENGQSDNLEKYSYDAEGRLIAIDGFVSGNPFYTEKLTYNGNRLIACTIEENGLISEFEVRSREGLIMEVILKSRNGNPVDTNTLRQEMQYDDKPNPLFKTLTGNYNRLEYFNNRNITQYKIYQNGMLWESQSYELGYEYDNFGNPVKVSSKDPSSNSIPIYSSYSCAISFS